ncbi:MAG: YggT family protein [Oscillospiraceae bacterium]|nr:YggT family protein [Oscillospiraceae bacterium]MBQ4545297.1 YggT family protein [Oscillospiraceae bacterium]MBQ6901527.1 YggT family protein [Oscillospiraceae bacterium]
MIINLLRTFMVTLLRAYELLFIVRAILSWFPMLQSGALINFLYSVTEPILAPIRNVLQKIPFLQGIPLDFSVLVAFLLIDILRTIIFYI